MDFFEAVKARRSVRRYTEEKVPPEVIEKALDAALLAPNSSNLQTWGFYWVKSPEKKEALKQACLNQGAAKTAAELVVVTADRKLWRESRDALLAAYKPGDAPEIVKIYYNKLVPILYGYPLLWPLKKLFYFLNGLRAASSRRPATARDVDEIAIKSAALGAENFMLAISAQGFDTCPMEGFDEVRVKRILSLSCSARVVMVISIGKRDPKGIWGPQFRLPKEKRVFTV